MHICVSKLATIGSDNGLSPVDSFIKEVNWGLTERPLFFNGYLAKRQLTSLEKETEIGPKPSYEPIVAILSITTHFSEILFLIQKFHSQKCT